MGRVAADPLAAKRIEAPMLPSPCAPGPTGLAPHPPAFRALDLAELRAGRAAADWLWHGYVAAGGVTLLTSPWKAGQTTLTAVLLARLGAGGTLAGRAVRPGRAVVVSADAAEDWLARADRFGFGPHVQFLCRPFCGRPTRAEWRALIDHLAGLRAAGRLDLAVIDPLAAFLPARDDGTAGRLPDALLPLRALTAAGAGVLVNHHPAKVSRAVGRAARRSRALAAYADVIIEMSWFSRPTDDDRRRVLAGFSRHPDTPRRRVIELTADGTDYADLGDFDAAELTDEGRALLGVLVGATDRLTRPEILAAWPPPGRKPDPVTLWRWLARGVSAGTIRRSGRGRKADPFVYWLAGKEREWADASQGDR
jgi:hypothetical protein